MKYFYFITAWVTLWVFTISPVEGQRRFVVEGGLDSSGICTRMFGHRPAARVLFESGMELSYFTNMELNMPAGQTGRSRKKGMYIDTLYFLTTAEDNARIIYLEAQGYFKGKIGPIRLLPKTTYRYIVYDPELIKKEPERKLLSYNLMAGAVSLLDYPSVGVCAGVGMNIVLYKRWGISPEVSYNRLSIHLQGRGAVWRDYVETNLYLRYEILSYLNAYVGYSRTFIDYNGSGFSLAGELFVYRRWFVRAAYNYYVNFENSLGSVSVGLKL